MSVSIEQVYTCDFCGNEIERLEQTVPHSQVPAVVHGQAEHLTVRTGYGFSRTHDICVPCWGDFLEWARQRKAEEAGA